MLGSRLPALDLDSITRRVYYWDCVLLPGLIMAFSPRGPFLDYNVWLTQSAATRMGVGGGGGSPIP